MDMEFGSKAPQKPEKGRGSVAKAESLEVGGRPRGSRPEVELPTPSAAGPSGPGERSPGDPWSRADISKLTGISVALLNAPEKICVGKDGGRPVYIGRFWAGSGSSGDHPQSPNHYLGVVEGVDRGNGFQGYMSVDYLLDKEKGLSFQIRQRTKQALGWKSLDAWKQEGQLLPMEHPLVQHWLLATYSHFQGGGEYADMARKKISEVYGEAGLQHFEESPAAKLLNSPEGMGGGRYATWALLAGAHPGHAVVDQLNALQTFDNKLRLMGTFNHQLPEVLSELARTYQLPEGTVRISQDLSTIWFGEEAFPYLANPGWVSGIGGRQHVLDDGVGAVLNSVAKHHLRTYAHMEAPEFI